MKTKKSKIITPNSKNQSRNEIQHDHLSQLHRERIEKAEKRIHAETKVPAKTIAAMIEIEAVILVVLVVQLAQYLIAFILLTKQTVPVNKENQAGADFGTGLNGLVQQFSRHLPLPFKHEESVGRVELNGSGNATRSSDVCVCQCRREFWSERKREIERFGGSPSRTISIADGGEHILRMMVMCKSLNHVK
ncbi:hypothetical protein ACOSQ4_001014 [Xanthoceras sorbifolium]